MAAIIAKIDDIRTGGGKVVVKYGKTEREFNSRAEAVDALTLTPQEIRDFMLKLLITEWRRRNPAGNNPSLITGTRAVYNLDLATLTPLTFEVI